MYYTYPTYLIYSLTNNTLGKTRVTSIKNALTLSYPILPILLTQKGNLGKGEKPLLPVANARYHWFG